MNRFDIASSTWDLKPSSQLIAKTTSKELRKYLSLENKEILDYGCGTGLFAFSISDEAKFVTGMDNSSGMVEVFNKKVEELNFNNLKAIKHNIETQNLDENKYDIIATSMTLHHIENIDMFFQKSYIALKKDGYLCISDLAKKDGKFHTSNKDVFHNGFSKDDIEKFYSEHGYKLIMLEDICQLDKNGSKYPIFLSIGQKI